MKQITYFINIKNNQICSVENLKRNFKIGTLHVESFKHTIKHPGAYLQYTEPKGGSVCTVHGTQG